MSLPPVRRPPRLVFPGRRRERLAAAFVLGLALFNPPLLAVASRDILIWGVPLLYLWLFGGWLLLIVILALVAERPGGGDVPPATED